MYSLTPAHKEKDKKKKWSAGAIAGLVIALVVVALIIGWLVRRYWLRRKGKVYTEPALVEMQSRNIQQVLSDPTVDAGSRQTLLQASRSRSR